MKGFIRRLFLPKADPLPPPTSMHRSAHERDQDMAYNRLKFYNAEHNEIIKLLQRRGIQHDRWTEDYTRAWRDE